MSDDEQPVEEVPQEEGESREQVLEIPLEQTAPMAQTVSKPKAKARGKRGPDKKPRAKPKPKARSVVERLVPAAEMEEESSDESVDEATLQELHSLNLLRSIRAYESQRHMRKQQLYSSWFGR